MPSYRERRLGPPLDVFVECVWELSDTGAQPAVSRIPPDGCVEAIFHLGERFTEVDALAPVPRVRQPEALIVGVWTKPILLESPAAFETVGIRFKPGCAPLFTGLAGAADSLANQAIEATSIWGRAARSLAARLADADDAAARLEAIREYLLPRLRPADPLALAAIGSITDTSGRTSIDALSKSLGVGARRLERAFLAHVGVPAKTFCRIVRFQSVLRRQPPSTAAGWADLAVACGYSDQSHLIRDFRQFAGETPAALAAADPSLADYFRRR